jgi:hypothetical protein
MAEWNALHLERDGLNKEVIQLHKDLDDQKVLSALDFLIIAGESLRVEGRHQQSEEYSQRINTRTRQRTLQRYAISHLQHLGPRKFLVA